MSTAWGGGRKPRQHAHPSIPFVFICLIVMMCSLSSIQAFLFLCSCGCHFHLSCPLSPLPTSFKLLLKAACSTGRDSLSLAYIGPTV